MRLLGWLILFLVSSTEVGAVTYSFQGSPFTNLSNHSTCALGNCFNYTGSDRVTGTFTVNGVLPANLSSQNISGSLVAWSFSDAHNTIASTDSRSFFGFGGVTVSTDCAGHVTNWFADVFQWATATPAGDFGGPKTLDARYSQIFSGGVLDGLDNTTDSVQNNVECLTINGGQCVLVPLPQTTDSSRASVATVGQWTGGGFGVSYDGNGHTGGSVSAACASHAAGETVPVAGNAGNLVRTGYAFAGWNTNPAGTGTHYAGDGTASFVMPGANVTLYAQWTATGFCSIPPQGLIGWWPGDGNASDKRGGNNGTLHGSAAYGTGEVLQGFSMAGNGYVEVPYGANLSTPLETVAVWVNPASQQGGGSIVNRRPVLNNTGFTLEQYYDHSGKVLWNQFVNGSSIAVLSNATLPLHTWTHVAGTFDGATARLYFNGAEVGNVAAAGSLDSVAPGTVLQFGRNIVAGSQFDGVIDEVMIFDRALGPAALQAIADAGGFGLCKSLIDVDANGQTDALTDGLMILRYLLGLPASTVATAAIGSNAARTSPTDIQAYLDQIKPALDVDGDTYVDAMTDGLLILRYLFGLRGAGLIDGAVTPGAPRATAGLIEQFIADLR